MIGFFSAIRLAKTKLKSKKIATGIVAVMASLLFFVLIFGGMVFSGVEQSTKKILNKINGEKYLVQTNAIFRQVFLTNKDLDSIEKVRAAKKFEQEFWTKRKLKYEKLGLKYDNREETPLLVPDALKSLDKSLPKELQMSFNRQSPVFAAYEKAKTEEILKQRKNKFEDLKDLSERYGASGYYPIYQVKLESFPQTRLIEKGVEDFKQTEKISSISDNGLLMAKNAVRNSDYVFMAKKLVEKHLILDQNHKLKGIPVIMTFQEAARMYGDKVGVSEHEPDAVAEKIEWQKKLQEKVAGMTYEVCYRNEIEQGMLAKIQSDFAEMKLNEGNEEYVAPKLIYDYPKQACGDILVKKDERSKAEKKNEAKRVEVLKKLGEYRPALHQKITFQVVGLMNPKEKVQKITSLENYVRNMFSGENRSMAVIPIEMYEKLPEEKKDLVGWSKGEMSDILEYAVRVLEFNSREEAKKFLDEAVHRGSVINYDENHNKEFMGEIFGINYLAILEIEELVGKFVLIVFPIVSILAIIMIGFLMMKLMDENRRETAIYRAMGAKRGDIAKIYSIYVGILSFRIAVLALVLGVIAAKIMDLVYVPNIKAMIQSILGINSTGLEFSIFEISGLIYVVVGMIFLSSMLAALGPILKNTWRSPIRDIREE